MSSSSDGPFANARGSGRSSERAGSAGADDQGESGRIAAGDVLRVEPAGREARVRSVQVHDTAVDVAEAGQRVAVALPGIERGELRRGDVLVALGAYASSYRLDVEVEELALIPPRALVHHGTAATLARVVRSGRFAQLRLAAPVVAARGDRLVLRAGTTVGGGRVIDPAPPRHADPDHFERSARGERLVYAPVRGPDGEWSWSEEWLGELRASLEQRLESVDPLDPGVPAPTDPWAPAVIPLLGLERRGAKLYRPGVGSSLGAKPIKVEDARLARFLEEQGRLVRVGDGYAISTAAYEQGRAVLVRELEEVPRITLARFRDLLQTSRKTAQLLLERFDADGITRRVGDERVLRRAGARR